MQQVDVVNQFMGNQYLKKTILLIDFDSTFIQDESLDVLADYVLQQRGHEALLKEFHHVTQMGMEGKLSFREGLLWRVRQLNVRRSDIDHVVKKLEKRISPSFKEASSFLKEHADAIYIVSGGFEEIIAPIVTSFGIQPSHILANRFLFNEKGDVVGIDETLPLSQDQGKVKAIKELGLQGNLLMIGDGMTDYQVKESGLASQFIAFTENVARPSVVPLADQVINNFRIFAENLTMSHSFCVKPAKGKVLLLENIHPYALDFFEQQGFEVEFVPGGLEEEELIQKLKGVHLLGIRSKTHISQKVLEASPDLLAIGAFCIGVNQIDLKTATKRGVAVFNAPFSNTRSVVELAIGSIIMLMRKILIKNYAMHQGKWDKSLDGAVEVRGKTLGIIGYGNIGAQLSILAESLGMQVLYYDLVDKLPLGNAKSCRHLAELLQQSDVVTVHVDGNASNKNLIGDKEFLLMKEGAYFLNLSRGHVVDIVALRKHLQSKKIAGAALDVYPQEPNGTKDQFYNDFQGMYQVLLTPHIGGNTQEAQFNIAKSVTNRLEAYFNLGITTMSVNFPEIQVLAMQKTHRFIHIHHNVPGVLAQISGVLAKHALNIEGQFLKTNDIIGVVITDVSSHYPHEVLEDLGKVKGTISLRILY